MLPYVQPWSVINAACRSASCHRTRLHEGGTSDRQLFSDKIAASSSNGPSSNPCGVLTESNNVSLVATRCSSDAKHVPGYQTN